jgi:hypothetical protein
MRIRILRREAISMRPATNTTNCANGVARGLARSIVMIVATDIAMIVGTIGKTRA